MKIFLRYLFSSLIIMKSFGQQPLYKSKNFSLYPDRVTQADYAAKALSSGEIVSNYKSPANDFLSPAITFKFSINGKDNEMTSGTDHHFICTGNGSCEMPVIKFGQQYIDTKAIPDNTYLKPNTRLTVRLDMTQVFEAFNANGYFTTYKGDKIYKEDFKGVYVAGGTAPLSWDFDNLVNKPELQLHDDNGDGIYETSLVLNSQKDEKLTSSTWKLSKDISNFPAYSSGYPISDALYKLATEEMVNAIEHDSTFRTGKEWAGVWTRDISYSIILSMAHLQPSVAKYSLLRKVKNGKIIQDTGTGGAYPASTDRIIWAVAAWELFKVTGDEDWLRQAYEIIKNSAADDMLNAYDTHTGLMKGESSFLDWREQTYPKWMQPVDIYESECLGTNAVHYQANVVLSKMATLLKHPEAALKYRQIAEGIKTGINKYLWMPEQGYYGQYLYGRNFKVLSPRAEALGEALCVLFGIADKRQQQVIQNTPVMDYGIPCIYPQIPNIPPYHNNAVWPFVQSYWALAAGKAGNEAAVMESIAAVYRPAALWVTNKENFVASNGDFAGTQINSSNMLWSLSGSLSLVHKLLFGMQFNENGLSFHPFVPFELKGKRSLSNFRYRDAQLTIEMEGYGNQVKLFTVDGKPGVPAIMPDLKGVHSIKIVLANNKMPQAKTNKVEYYVSPEAPAVTVSGNKLWWKAVPGISQYITLKNGDFLSKTNELQLAVNGDTFGEYQVIAVDRKGTPSFASEPVIIVHAGDTGKYEIEHFAPKSNLPYRGFSGDGFAVLTKTENKSVTIPVTIAESGLYTITFRYANGNGPINTENKCAIRTLKEGNKILGAVVLPQRGKEEWSNWGWSNFVKVNLAKGKHLFTVSFENFNENMNGDINDAMLDYMQITRIR